MYLSSFCPHDLFTNTRSDLGKFFDKLSLHENAVDTNVTLCRGADFD